MAVTYGQSTPVRSEQRKRLYFTVMVVEPGAWLNWYLCSSEA